MNEIMALVPMKGHSERVPDKNIRDFNGKPLLYWVIAHLYQSEYISQVVVDTDSEIIAEKCRQYFREIVIIERPAALQGDFVSMNQIIEHDLTFLKGDEFYLQTHATNPLLTFKTINRAVKVFMSNLANGYDSLFSVNRIQTRCYNIQGQGINHNPNELLRTQDLAPIYEENSNLYLFSRDSFGNSGKRIGKRPYLFEMNRYEAIDIDNEEDFKFAEYLYNYWKD
jgi:CMP-N-acetylneuraminic acid synthetase